MSITVIADHFSEIGRRKFIARQRVLRFLTPNPNSNEGVLWQEAKGAAVAVLDYELNLERVGSTPPV